MGIDRNHELDEMLAERAITKVIHQYAHAADRGDLDMMAGCFWLDATLDIGIYSGDAQTFIAGIRNAPIDPTRTSRHLIGNILIEVRLAEHEAKLRTALNELDEQWRPTWIRTARTASPDRRWYDVRQTWRFERFEASGRFVGGAFA